MSDSDAIREIQNQTSSSSRDDVFVIEILSIRFPQFTVRLKQQLEKYTSMQMMTFNSCGIKSLSFFPVLPSLIRLDLVKNEIEGSQLIHLQGCRHLQTIMLGGNKVEKTDDLLAFKGMKQLFQLNFLSNPIQNEAGYRNKVFSMFPSLTVLDGLDKGGKDAFNATSMANTTSRVPSTLFDTSRYVPSTSLSGGAPSPAPFSFGTGSFLSGPASFPIPHPARKRAPTAISPVGVVGKAGKGGKAGKTSARLGTGSRSMSTRAGLVFPVGRIRRHLKTNDSSSRLSKGSSVFLAAVLQYLTAEVVELAGNIAKSQKKVRITPKMIRQVFNQDAELKATMNDVIIPRQQ